MQEANLGGGRAESETQRRSHCGWTEELVKLGKERKGIHYPSKSKHVQRIPLGLSGLYYYMSFFLSVLKKHTWIMTHSNIHGGYRILPSWLMRMDAH